MQFLFRRKQISIVYGELCTIIIRLTLNCHYRVHSCCATKFTGGKYHKDDVHVTFLFHGTPNFSLSRTNSGIFLFFSMALGCSQIKVYGLLRSWAKENTFLSGSLSHLLIKVCLHVMQRAEPRDWVFEPPGLSEPFLSHPDMVPPPPPPPNSLIPFPTPIASTKDNEWQTAATSLVGSYNFYLKGLCHEINNFVEVLNIPISTFCTCADGFFGICIIMEKIEGKLLACFFENTLSFLKFYRLSKNIHLMT